MLFRVWCHLDTFNVTRRRKDVDSVNAIIEQNTVAEIHSVVPSDFWTAPSDFFNLICEQCETISDEEIWRL